MSTDGKLFAILENSWYFRSGPDLDSGPTCLVNFRVSTETERELMDQVTCVGGRLFKDVFLIVVLESTL